ncbi:MAG TPA: hypothetical protein VH702_01980, partial [Vicinamibacterales bacterium]
MSFRAIIRIFASIVALGRQAEARLPDALYTQIRIAPYESRVNPPCTCGTFRNAQTPSPTVRCRVTPRTQNHLRQLERTTRERVAQQLRLSGPVACSRTDSDSVELRRARAADASQQAMREDPMNYLVTYLKSFVRK